MIITCEKCKTGFDVDERLLKNSGSKVRCAVCQHVFVAYPSISSIDHEESAQTRSAAGSEEKVQDVGSSDSTDSSETGDVDAANENDTLAGIDASTESELVDIEKMLEIGLDEESTPDDSADEEIEGFDLGLDLEETTKVSSKTIKTDEEEFDLSDLDLDADEQTSTASELEEIADELDLSDLEKVLETYEDKSDENTEEDMDAEPDELEFDLEFDLEPDVASAEAEDSEEYDSAEDLDLTELDAILETGESEKEDLETKFDELDFELDVELPAEKKSEGVKSEELEMEFEIEDEGSEAISMDAVAEEASIDRSPVNEEDSESLDLQSAIDEKDHIKFGESEATDDTEHTTAYDKSVVMGILPEDVQDIDKAAATGIGEDVVPPRKRTKISPPVLIISIIVLLGAGGYLAVNALKNAGIQIPFISEFFKGEPSDVDKIEMVQDSLSSEFISNSSAGKLFVITGRARNGHSETRSFIQITGKIYKKGKVLADSSTVYCGNVLSTLDLSNLDMDTINKRLQKTAGDNKSNIHVGPGKTIPFMIVFSNLPDDLDEFEIESAGSFASQ